jgi:protein-disulfide isomerase/uncharacterized membrane protein YphA (DoxX/SURF4 family)
LAYAALTKISDPAATVRAVRAYQLLPESVAVPFGHALPAVELAVAVLLLLGVGLRFTGAAAALLMTMFVGGIASAWARGLRIDCGCFGGGGVTDNPHYVGELLRDGGLLVLAVAVMLIGRSRLALDAPPPAPSQAVAATAGGSRHEQRRSKVAAARARTVAAQARRRWLFQQAIAAGTVIVAALIAVVVSHSPGSVAAVPTPPGVTAAGGIVVGDPGAPHRLVVFEDPQCPVCGRFEHTSGAVVSQAVAAGRVSVEYRMRSFLGPESVRAVAALGAAQQAGKFEPLRAALFAHQPKEGTGGYTISDLLSLGAQVGLTDAGFTAAVRQQTYARWAGAVDNQASRDHNVGTPELRLDGHALGNDVAFDTVALARALGASA